MYHLKPGLHCFVFHRQVHKTVVPHYLNPVDYVLELQAPRPEIRTQRVHTTRTDSVTQRALDRRTLHCTVDRVLDQQDSGARTGQSQACVEATFLEGGFVNGV